MPKHAQLTAGWITSVTAAVTLVAALPSGADAQLLGQSIAQVRLVELDLAGISDREYVGLIEIIADDVPVNAWPTVRIEEGDGLERIVDRAYDLYAGDRTPTELSRPYPESAQLLVDRIEVANGIDRSAIVAGGELRIPPVPVRPRTQPYDDATGLLYAPARVEALVYGRLSSVAVPSGIGADSISDVAWTRAAPNAVRWGMNGLRDAEVVTLVASETAAREIVELAIGDPRVLPIERLTVDLIQEQRCGSEDSSLALSDSPYLQRALDLVDAARADLTQRAIGRELVVIDTGFVSGHGAKVLRAAKWLLSELGAAQLHPYVLPYEISPRLVRDDPSRPDRNAYEPLRRDVAAYYNMYRISDDQFKDAATWLTYSSQAERDLQLQLPPILLQAAIWSQLRQGRWLNLSWRALAPSGALPLNWQDLVDDAFVVVASGNEAAAIRSDITPQNAASTSRRFVNVTHGSPDGDIYGSWTSRSGARVDLIGPGCFAALDARMTGSSFASAVVAASAWLKHLLDDTPASKIREQLIQSSSLLPTAADTTRSRGVFDPARLIADVGAHYRRRDDVIVPLSGAVQLSAPGCASDLTTPADTRRGSRDVIVYEDEGSHFLVKRTTDIANPDVVVTRPCQLTTLSVIGDSADGREVLRVSSPAEFVESVAHLSY